MQGLIDFTAQYLFLCILAAEGAYVLLRHRVRFGEFAVAALFIGGLSFLISLICNRYIQDPRPFVVGGFSPAIKSSRDNGFPSDHTLLLAASAAVMMLGGTLAGILAFIGALVVGAARVAAGVHHALDIAGSVLIVSAASGVYYLLRRKWPRTACLKKLPNPLTKERT